MQLSAQSIRTQCGERLKEHYRLIDPFYEQFLQSGSYDLHLGGKLLLPIHTGTPIDLRKSRTVQYHTLNLEKDGDYVLNPGERALGQTIEYLCIPYNLQARMDGKSSLGRDGLETHRTAGVFDGGFQGNAVLELHIEDQCEPWVLYYGMPIAQISFYQLDAVTDKPYSHTTNHYQEQRETVGNRTVDKDNPFLRR